MALLTTVLISVPVSAAQASLATVWKPARVTLELDGTTPEWDYADGVATVHVPEVAIHRAIAIESEERKEQQSKMDIEDTSNARLQATPEGVQRFRDMRFGLSVHWGLYALIGQGEWVMHQAQIPVSEYEQLVERFNPTLFDAQAWIDLAVEAGAQAFLITSKHHDGFCMYDTALSDYKITNTPFGRDPIAELAEACHQHGVALHFYYSLLDWHHPAYRSDWPAYVDYYQGQVRELCTQYGLLGGMLFDGYWPRTPFTAETGYFRPGGSWDLAGTYDLIHSPQPDAMVVNNHHVLPLKGEDYQAFELDMPGENTTGFNTTEVGDLPLATWFNVNRGWSYFEDEQQVKSADRLLGYLTGSAERGARCWLNVGPTSLGDILPEEATELRKLARLMEGKGSWLRRQKRTTAEQPVDASHPS
jgi:alpha-L-fucosidase